MCGTHKHIGGNTAERLDDRPREKKIPQAPKRPALKAVDTVAKEGVSTVAPTVSATVGKVKKACGLSKVMAEVEIRQRIEVRLGESSFLDSRDADDIIAREVGDECEACGDCTDGIEWARGIVGKIVNNRAKIAEVLPGLLTLEIARLNRKLKPVELDDVIKRSPDLMLDARFATIRAIKFMNEFFPKQPASQPVAHIGGGGRETSVAAKKPESAPVTAPATTIIDAEVIEAKPALAEAETVDAEIVEAPAPERKSKPEVDLKDIEVKLRKKIQGAFNQRTDGSGLDNDELFSIAIKLLPRGCDNAVIQAVYDSAKEIMNGISPSPVVTAPAIAKALPEAKSKPAEVVPAQKIEPVVPPAAMKSVETPPVEPEDKKPGGLLGRLRAFVSGIGQKPVAEHIATQEKPVVVKPTEPPVAIPKVQPTAKKEKPAVQPEKPVATVAKPVEAPKAPKIKESPEKADLRNILTDLRTRESTLRKGERGKDERKAFYRNLASQLVERLKIKSTGETAKDRELIKKELLKSFGEQELRAIGPEWLFK